jgi:hypothetical protein
VQAKVPHFDYEKANGAWGTRYLPLWKEARVLKYGPIENFSDEGAGDVSAPATILPW